MRIILLIVLFAALTGCEKSDCVLHCRAILNESCNYEKSETMKIKCYEIVTQCLKACGHMDEIIKDNK